VSCFWLEYQTRGFVNVVASLEIKVMYISGRMVELWYKRRVQLFGDRHSYSDNSQPEKAQSQCHLSTDTLSAAHTQCHLSTETLSAAQNQCHLPTDYQLHRPSVIYRKTLYQLHWPSAIYLQTLYQLYRTHSARYLSRIRYFVLHHDWITPKTLTISH